MKRKPQGQYELLNRALAHLAELGIVHERTGQKRNRVFSYAEYMAILKEGTELPE